MFKKNSLILYLKMSKFYIKLCALKKIHLELNFGYISLFNNIYYKKNLEDKKILKRSSESLRDRYRKYLKYLSDENL